MPESSSFKSMSLVKSETAHRTIIKVVTSKEGAGGSREREQEVAEGEHGGATSEQGRAERDERSVSARAKRRDLSKGQFGHTAMLYIYIYYTIPELRIENCRFGLGKGAGPLQREQRGSTGVMHDAST